jgi:hypothetical protein
MLSDILDQRTHLLHDNRTLDTTSDRINRALRVGEESERIGASIITHVIDQNDQLQRTADTLDETDVELTSARRTLNSIWLCVITNKLIWLLVVIVELAAIALIWYVRWGRFII